jgi:hypothetical protein
MITPKSQAEVNAEIERLEQLLKQVPHHSEFRCGVNGREVFSEDNHWSIAAQIQVLKGEVSDDEIYRKGWPYYVENFASIVDPWMRGYADDEQPSLYWTEMKQ